MGNNIIAPTELGTQNVELCVAPTINFVRVSEQRVRAYIGTKYIGTVRVRVYRENERKSQGLPPLGEILFRAPNTAGGAAENLVEVDHAITEDDLLSYVPSILQHHYRVPRLRRANRAILLKHRNNII